MTTHKQLRYSVTTYRQDGEDRTAIRVTWSDLADAGFKGDGSDEAAIAAALRAAGAPGDVLDADEGAVDAHAYYLLGSRRADPRRPSS